MPLKEGDACDVWCMYPPNQCDWSFKLTKISDTRWHVFGTRDMAMFWPTYEMDDFWERDDDGWKYVEKFDADTTEQAKE